MGSFDRQKHWENIYQSKRLEEVSWYQPTPKTSLSFLKQFNIPKHAKIIDVGGGDSLLVDHLIDLGYLNITVLDISESALKRARQRLGNRANKVKWIVADAETFVATEQYDFWHDRAAFHFLTEEQEIETYLENAQRSIKPEGILMLGTFSEEGPQKCSGIKIKQYSESTMTALLQRFFEKLKCKSVNHKTPFETIQQFTFCSFRKLQIDLI
ncbi:class I SAM-dependent methyltransferase [Echinicola vietnamensis]|uniref:Methylase involved in ubiquinone/menaquinone biosynthesis n=1 Tax=Echinicola vietnamensis (strain DSM 17526 / LMG 23754 / KMM 6221) TaxID=926556 RepID=L0G4U7_ECHVK|nr:class I SAM-dependent methyltransferase [Echinicola vietnamensis]AGA80348.1 methylase involved in ubiquinone/menaquinone biosynthesis [Echinicola vietnamensis DSM 17526]